MQILIILSVVYLMSSNRCQGLTLGVGDKEEEKMHHAKDAE